MKNETRPTITHEFAMKQVRRLSGKKGWPFFDEGAAELGRVLMQYAKDERQAWDVVTWFCENSETCPAPNELRYELRGPSLIVPDTPKNCKLMQCDGGGYIEVFSMHTRITIPNAAAYVEKKSVTREQYNDLSDKIDWVTQQVFTGVKKCQCRL